MRRIYVILFIISIAANIYFYLVNRSATDEIVRIRYERELLEESLAASKEESFAMAALAAKRKIELQEYIDSTNISFKTSLTNTQKYYEKQIKDIKKYNIAAFNKFFEQLYPSPGVRSRQLRYLDQVESQNGSRRSSHIRKSRQHIRHLPTTDITEGLSNSFSEVNP